MSDVYASVVDEATIADRVAELGAQIAADYKDRDLTLVGILHGSLPFLTDLSRHLPTSTEIDFLALTRFGREGRVSIAMDTADSMSGRHVLIVEDIVDTGLTLSTLRKLFGARDVASIAAVTLLDKAPRRIVDVRLEYRGFEVGDEFLLGYGLDWEGKYRNLRELWAVLDLAEHRAAPEALAQQVFADPGDSLSP